MISIPHFEMNGDYLLCTLEVTLQIDNISGVKISGVRPLYYRQYLSSLGKNH